MAHTPPRLPDFPYKGFNRYFLTICANDRVPVFLDVEFGRSIVLLFLQRAVIFRFEIIVYCVMPDHMHLLVHGASDDALLRKFIERCKQLTGYDWKHNRRHSRTLWQEGYFDRILRDNDPDEGVINYIVQNPVRGGLVEDARDYALTGSPKYTMQELLECTMLWTPPWK